jgi:hypothetical protein
VFTVVPCYLPRDRGDAQSDTQTITRLRATVRRVGVSRGCRAALIFDRLFFCRLPARQPFWKTKYAITILRQFGRPIEGLWQLRRSLAGAQGLYPSVQVAQQVIDCVGDFSGNPNE